MCNPMIVAGLAASAAGTGYNSYQQNKNLKAGIEAKNKASLDEVNRQDAFQAEATEVFDNSLNNFSKPSQDAALQKSETDRTIRLEKAITQPKEYTPTTGSAPSVVKSEIARKMNDAIKSGKNSARSLAKMGAWGDTQFGNRIDLSRSGGDLGQISNFARGSANLLPGAQSAAYGNAQDAPGMFGDLLKVAGTAGMMYGMNGGSFGKLGGLFGGGGGDGTLISVDGSALV
ncbi:MAG: hypothetical protein ABJN40_06030 [Sneathiella sp.]